MASDDGLDERDFAPDYVELRDHGQVQINCPVPSAELDPGLISALRNLQRVPPGQARRENDSFPPSGHPLESSGPARHRESSPSPEGAPYNTLEGYTSRYWQDQGFDQGHEQNTAHPYQPAGMIQPAGTNRAGTGMEYWGSSDMQARPVAPNGVFSDEVDDSGSDSLFGEDPDDSLAAGAGTNNPQNNTTDAPYIKVEPESPTYVKVGRQERGSRQLQANPVDSFLDSSAYRNPGSQQEYLAQPPAYPTNTFTTDKPSYQSSHPEPDNDNDIPSPTESQLQQEDFAFHNELSEEERLRRFDNDLFWAAMQDVSPKLSAKEQWYAWRKADKTIRDGDTGSYYEWLRQEQQRAAKESNHTSDAAASQPAGAHVEEHNRSGNRLVGTGMPVSAASDETGGRSGAHNTTSSHQADLSDQHTSMQPAKDGREDSNSSTCQCKSGKPCSCAPSQCQCKGKSTSTGNASTCCPSGCKCGEDCACSPSECSCQVAREADNEQERVKLGVSTPHKALPHDRLPGYTSNTPRTQPRDGEGEDSSPLPQQPQMTPLDQHEYRQQLDKSPQVSHVRQSVEPEETLSRNRESTPAYVDRSPSPSPVDRRGDLHMRDATPHKPSQKVHERKAPPNIVRCIRTVRPVDNVWTEHVRCWMVDGTFNERTVRHLPPAGLDAHRWYVGNTFDHNQPLSAPPAIYQGMQTQNPVQIQDGVASADNISPRTIVFPHPPPPHQPAPIPQGPTYFEGTTLRRDHLNEGRAAAMANSRNHQHDRGNLPLSATTAQFYVPPQTSIQDLYYSIEWIWAPERPDHWITREAGDARLRPMLGPPPPEMVAMQPIRPPMSTYLPPAPPIPRSPDLPSPPSLRPSKTRDTKGKGRRKSAVAGSKVEKAKPKPRSATTTKGGRKATASAKTGQGPKRVPSTPKSRKPAPVEGTRKSTRIRERMERMSSSPAPGTL